jgi:hypothetical protein
MLKFRKGQGLNTLTRDGENGELVQGIVKFPDALQKHIMSVSGQWTCRQNLMLRHSDKPRFSLR